MRGVPFGGREVGCLVSTKRIFLLRATRFSRNPRLVRYVESLLGDENGDEEVDPNVLRIDWRSLQMSKISRKEEENGMFNTYCRCDDRYSPFEGSTGAVSSWTLELGANEWNEENQVDMREILEDLGSFGEAWVVVQSIYGLSEHIDLFI